MTVYAKLVVDMPPKLYKEFSEAVREEQRVKAQVVRGMIESYLVERESHPSGKMFGGEKKRATRRRMK